MSICMYDAIASDFYTDLLLIFDSKLFYITHFRELLLIHLHLWKGSSQVLNSYEDRV